MLFMAFASSKKNLLLVLQFGTTNNAFHEQSLKTYGKQGETEVLLFSCVPINPKKAWGNSVCNKWRRNKPNTAKTYRSLWV
jgi:hypothetical protein